MIARRTGRRRRRLGWLLLAQGLWLPLLLLLPHGPWGFRQGSLQPTGREALLPLPAASGSRSRPPSLGELLAPTASREQAPGIPEGQLPAAGGSAGVLLLNRPRAVATARGNRNASPEPGTPAVTGQGSARQGTSMGSRQSGAGQDEQPAGGRQLSPSQLLGGSLGLEELGRTRAPQARSGSAPVESTKGASATSSHP